MKIIVMSMSEEEIKSMADRIALLTFRKLEKIKKKSRKNSRKLESLCVIRRGSFSKPIAAGTLAMMVNDKIGKPEILKEDCYSKFYIGFIPKETVTQEMLLEVINNNIDFNNILYDNFKFRYIFLPEVDLCKLKQHEIGGF